MPGPDPHYLNPRLAELYDFDSPWSADRDFYLALARSQRMAILDLGCGTGLLCDAYAARGHDVTGVDPAPAMLNVARRKPFGDKIEWVQASAQSYRPSRQFDLIVMTGHAFQTLLDDEDVLAALTTMRLLMKPQGRAVFETRNPLVNWEADWNYDLDIAVDGRIVRETRRFVAMSNDRLQSKLEYQFSDETLVSESVIRFPSRQDIEAKLDVAGLRVDQFFGDWMPTPFNEQTSTEMIFVLAGS